MQRVVLHARRSDCCAHRVHGWAHEPARTYPLHDACLVGVPGLESGLVTDEVVRRPATALLILAISLAARTFVVLALPAGLDLDTDGYREVALTLRTSGVYGVTGDFDGALGPSETATVKPTAYRPPLYPVLLAALVSGGRLHPLAVGVLHVVLGVATVLLVFRLGGAWKLGPWSALAALLTAFDPILLNQSAQIMTETPAAFLAAAALLCLTSAGLGVIPANDARNERGSARWVVLKWLSSGGLIGAASLVRPTFLPWGVLVLVTLPLSGAVGKTRWKHGLALALGMAIALFPWGFRNYLTLDRFILSTTHGGYTLLVGNNPAFYRFLRESDWGDVWPPDELAVAWSKRDELRSVQDDLFALDSTGSQRTSTRVGRSELEDDELAYAFAERFIRTEPAMFVRASIGRVGRLWHVWPRSYAEDESSGRTLLRLATAAWYLMLYGLVVIAVVRYRSALLRAPWLWGILLCLAFTGVHSVYWSDMRMRGPLMPVLSLLAAAGARAIWTSRGRQRSA